MNSINFDHNSRRTDTRLDPAAIYRAAATSADVGIIVQNMKGIVLWANAAYARIMGYDAHELIGLNPLTYALPEAETPTEEDIANFRYEKPKDGSKWIEVVRNVRSDGTLFWMEMNVSFTKLRGDDEVVILVARDISDHVSRRQQIEKNAEELRRLALTDSLTGLANRHALMQTIYEVWDQNEPQRLPISILYVDVDRMRQINDSAGQAAGDFVLKELAKRLKVSMAPYDLLARTGGDEFIILCRSADTEDALMQFANALVAVAREPVRYSGKIISSSLSIGAAIVPPGGLGPETLLKRANFALKNAKEMGPGAAAVYDQALHKLRTAEDQLIEELKVAIPQNQLRFYFQPTMSLATGKVSGFETLVRWNNPRLGLLSPDKFLHLAEKTGLMADLDFAALDAALELLCALREAGYGHIRVGINGSAELLASDNFAMRFFAALDRSQIEPRSVVFEVLETVIFEDMSPNNPLVRVVQTLHDCGITVLLDDFGTGHAGLNHLAKLAVGGIKIDRSLIENVLTDPTSAKIVAMMFDLCKDLGLYVVTEGIETPKQAVCLRDLGATAMQGYWLSRPMPSDEVLAWLRAHPDWLENNARSVIAATQ